MAQIGTTDIRHDGIRELTSNEIAAVAGGTQGGSLCCIISEIRSIVCQVERLICCCFNTGNNG